MAEPALAIVCGGGPAGLAAAGALQESGIDTLVLERGVAVGTSWRNRYDGLRLNTPGWMSTLPGYRASRREYGEFPSRDEWVRYLEDYTAHHGLDVRCATHVRRIDRVPDGWSVQTDREVLRAPFVVVATGYDHEPYLPPWPGVDSFTGELLHASDYRSPLPFRGRDVLVVGANVTGTEVAAHLVDAGAARVRVACRTPPNIIRRTFLGLSVNVYGIVLNHLPVRVADTVGRVVQRLLVGRLDRHGLPPSPEGIASLARQRQRSPAYDDGFVAHLKAGRIEITPAATDLRGPDVVLADGSRIQPDVVIAATGYHRGLQELVGHLGVLDEEGRPSVAKGRDHPAARGLFFNGYRADLGGQLRLMRIDARALARTIRRRVGAT